MRILGSKLWLGIVGGVAAGALVAVAWMAPAAVANASSTTLPGAAHLQQQQPEQQQAQWRDLRLAHLFKQEGLQAQIQADRIAMARDAADQAQQRLDQLTAQGRDVTVLTTALGTFRTQIDAAQTAWNSNQAALNAKAGFDANGQVVDASQAQTTVRDVANGLRNNGTLLLDAAREFRQAVREYRQANAASPKPANPPTPTPQAGQPNAYQGL